MKGSSTSVGAYKNASRSSSKRISLRWPQSARTAFRHFRASLRRVIESASFSTSSNASSSIDARGAPRAASQPHKLSPTRAPSRRSTYKWPPKTPHTCTATGRSMVSACVGFVVCIVPSSSSTEAVRAVDGGSTSCTLTECNSRPHTANALTRSRRRLLRCSACATDRHVPFEGCCMVQRTSPSDKSLYAGQSVRRVSRFSQSASAMPNLARALARRAAASKESCLGAR